MYTSFCWDAVSAVSAVSQAEVSQNQDRYLKCEMKDHKMDTCQSKDNVGINCVGSNKKEFKFAKRTLSI